jgi:hypothetical protein
VFRELVSLLSGDIGKIAIRVVHVGSRSLDDLDDPWFNRENVALLGSLDTSWGSLE